MDGGERTPLLNEPHVDDNPRKDSITQDRRGRKKQLHRVLDLLSLTVVICGLTVISRHVMNGDILGGGHGSNKGSFAESSEEPNLLRRTFASVNAQLDSDFVSTQLGIKMSVNMSSYCSKQDTSEDRQACAIRKGHSDARDFDLHFLESRATPMGETSVEDWVNYWQSLNSNFDEDFKWHRFMSQAVSLYSPDLSPFILRWRNSGTAMLLRQYDSPLDGRTIYSGRVSIPHTGTIIEVVSDKVSQHLQDSFFEYAVEECVEANFIAWTVNSMQNMWSGVEVNELGLPDLLVVQISNPAEDASEMPAYFQSTTGVKLNSSSHSQADLACQWSDIAFNVRSGDSNQVVLRMVQNSQAFEGEHHYSEYENYVTETVDALVGYNQGFSRYLDSNIALELPESVSLDLNAELLRQSKVSYHSSDNDDGGINWSRGSNGLGVEFNGRYDMSHFNADDLRQMDSCSSTGFPVSNSDADFCAE